MIDMPQTDAIPTRAQAEALLTWAQSLNPGPWVQHSQAAARAAQAIAARCNLDPERAYVLGLMHDIGRYEGVRDLHHVVAGYSLALNHGWPGVARICLTHSFPVRELDSYAGRHDCSPDELAMLRSFIASVEYDIYDELIQLCDALALPGRISLMDSRLIDVALRHGLNDYTLDRWKLYYARKAHFDALSGSNIYELFRDEIIHSVFD